MNVRNYQLLQELGRGTFGITYLGYDTVNNRNVAVKTIDINKSMSLGADINAINEEIDTLKALSSGTCSKYVACYYENFQDNFNGADTMFIVSEYINGSSLTSFIQNNNGTIPPTVLWALYLQLLLGLQYIHDLGYAHRDIKPDNILITDDYTIKYIDFGLACVQQCQVLSCTNTCRGTPGTFLYMPPEFFNKQRQDSLAGSKAHDMWSLAVVMFQMANGINSFPFQAFEPDQNGQIQLLPNDQLAYHIAQAPEYSSNYSLDDARTNSYLTSLLVNDWKLRFDVGEAKQILTEQVMAIVWACS